MKIERRKRLHLRKLSKILYFFAIIFISSLMSIWLSILSRTKILSTKSWKFSSRNTACLQRYVKRMFLIAILFSNDFWKMKILCCDVINDWESTMISRRQRLWKSMLQSMISLISTRRLTSLLSESMLEITLSLTSRFWSSSSKITTRQIHKQNSCFHSELHLQLHYRSKLSLFRKRNQSNHLIITLMIINIKTVNVLVLVINILHDQNAIISILLFDLQISMRIFKFERKLISLLLQIHEWQHQLN